MLERLARTMYRRRRSVLVGLDRAARRRLRARRRHRRRVQDRVQAPGHREPGGVRPARALELPQPPDPGPDRVPGRRRASTTRRCRRRWRACSPRSSEEVDRRHRRQPVQPPRVARQVGRNGRSRTRSSTSPTGRRRSSLDAGKEIKAERRRDRRRGAHDRVRRRHVRRPTRSAGRARRSACSPPWSSSSSRSGRCSRWGCPSAPRCSASAPASRSC